MHCKHCRYTLCRDCGKAIWCCNAPPLFDWWDDPHRVGVAGWNHFVSAGHIAAPKRSVSAGSSLGLAVLGARMFW